MMLNYSLCTEDLRRLPDAFFNNIVEMTQSEVSFVVLNAMLGKLIGQEKLREIADKWITEESVLKPIDDGMFVYEFLSGAAMSIYDFHGKLVALLSEILNVNNEMKRVVVCSHDDSSIALASAFKSESGYTPFVLQSVGVLSDLEKRQLKNTVPEENLCVVKCDDRTLSLISKKALEYIGNDSSLWFIDDNDFLVLISRVAMLFDMFRRLRIVNQEAGPCVCCNHTEDAMVQACELAVKLGLRLNYKVSNVDFDRNEQLLDAYNKTGYIFSPRSIDQWVTLSSQNYAENEIGVVIQNSHPAKHKKLLEPLLNKVMPLPYKLYFNDEEHIHYKYNAPTVNTILHFLTD